MRVLRSIEQSYFWVQSRAMMSISDESSLVLLWYDWSVGIVKNSAPALPNFGHGSKYNFKGRVCYMHT